MTKGPWRVGRKIGRTIYANDVLIGIMDRAEDATLAASAPELLEALKLVVDDIESADYGGEISMATFYERESLNYSRSGRLLAAHR